MICCQYKKKIAAMAAEFKEVKGGKRRDEYLDEKVKIIIQDSDLKTMKDMTDEIEEWKEDVEEWKQHCRENDVGAATFYHQILQEREEEKAAMMKKVI